MDLPVVTNKLKKMGAFQKALTEAKSVILCFGCSLPVSKQHSIRHSITKLNPRASETSAVCVLMGMCQYIRAKFRNATKDRTKE